MKEADKPIVLVVEKVYQQARETFDACDDLRLKASHAAGCCIIEHNEYFLWKDV
jgi:hypothetical protein